MTIRQITGEIEQAYALKQISIAYTEIASNKLHKIRSMVEKNRSFLTELSGVYKIVKQQAYQRKLLQPKKKKTVSVLLTSNEHFFGNINQALTAYFTNAMKDGVSDLVVIGNTANEWLKGVGYKAPYTFVHLQRDYPTNQELDGLVQTIKDYNQIVVFHSQMKTVLLQTSTSVDITQTTYLRHVSAEEQAREFFIFEPELVKILDFFEREVMNLLLQQAFLEANLSQTASRLVAMDQSQLNADKVISGENILLDHARRTIANTRLLETYSALMLRKENAFYD